MDGIEHINIYSKGQTTLGKWLSNLAPVRVEIDGIVFPSLENYWFWLSASEEARPYILKCSGWEAKAYMKRYPQDRVKSEYEEDFRAKIIMAMKLKLFQHPSMAKVFARSTLPFRHYYSYGGKEVPAGYDWIVEGWEAIRRSKRFQEWIDSL